MTFNNFTFKTLNVQGLRNVCNRQTLFSWLNCAKPDIIAVQERHSTSKVEFQTLVNRETQDNNNKQSYLVDLFLGRIGTGVAILYKPCFVIAKEQRDKNGRFLLITFSHEEVDSHFQVLTVYGPNQQRLDEEFFASLLPEINPSLPIILCGDLLMQLLTRIWTDSVVIRDLLGHIQGLF